MPTCKLSATLEKHGSPSINLSDILHHLPSIILIVPDRHAYAAVPDVQKHVQLQVLPPQIPLPV